MKIDGSCNTMLKKTTTKIVINRIIIEFWDGI